MARRRYIFCGKCETFVLVAGEPMKGDIRCLHRFSRTPITSTVYYENAQGQRLYPWTSDDLPKAYTRQGYQRFEVPASEIRRFEKRVNREMESERREQSDREREQYERERNYRHASLRDDMRQMGDFERAVAEEAIQREDDGYSHRYDPEFHVGAYN